MYRLLFSSRAGHAFRSLPSTDAQRVKRALHRLQEDPRTRGVVALHDLRLARYRFRVGNYRILFDISERERVIEVLDIRRRDERTYR